MERLYTKPSLLEFGALRDLTKATGSITDQDIIFSSTPIFSPSVDPGSADNCIVIISPGGTPTAAGCPDFFPGGQVK